MIRRLSSQDVDAPRGELRRTVGPSHRRAADTTTTWALGACTAPALAPAAAAAATAPWTALIYPRKRQPAARTSVADGHGAAAAADGRQRVRQHEARRLWRLPTRPLAPAAPLVRSRLPCFVCATGSAHSAAPACRRTRPVCVSTASGRKLTSPAESRRRRASSAAEDANGAPRHYLSARAGAVLRA
jgi:hypothetical protein